MQTTSKIVMVRPYKFAFNEETAQNNFFQKSTENDSVATKALEEFDTLVSQLKRNDIDVMVVQDTAEPWTPDAIFPNNWFSSHHSGELVLYPMFAKNRQLERKPDVLKLLTGKIDHRKVIDLTLWEKKGEYLEGTGSMVFDRDKKVAYCCRSPRTSEKVLAEFCAKLNFDAVLFDATDKNGNPIYHTNVMMSVGNQVAIVCLESIKDEKEQQKVVAKLTAAGKIIVDITLDQVGCFAGNMLELKNRNGHPFMVMSTSARSSLTEGQENIISTYTTILSSPLSTIETNGGGSARCMIAEIFY